MKKVKINKKKYISPDFEYCEIEFLEDILTSSQPDEGNWGYFDEETLPETETATDIGDIEFWN